MKMGAKRHPKLDELRTRLNCSRPTAIGYLELLWDGVSEFAISGNVGKFSDGVIAKWCDWEGDASEFVSALVVSGWLDSHETHRLVVHDWHQHCPNWVRSKLKRSGLKFASETSDPTYTPTSDPTYVATGETTSEATYTVTSDGTIPTTSCQATPSPTTTTTTARGEHAESNAWTMAAAAASKMGLATARVKVERCRDSGVPIEQVEAALDYWRSHREEFDGPGALGMKLDAMVPGQPADEGWPKRTRPVARSDDIWAECDAVRALGDDELDGLAAAAFKGKLGLQTNWREQGRRSSSCIEHIARFRIRSRNNGAT